MAFTSLAVPARYGSDQSTGLRLPATVSRNTPAAETRQSMVAVFRPGMNGDDILAKTTRRREWAPFVGTIRPRQGDGLCDAGETDVWRGGFQEQQDQRVLAAPVERGEGGRGLCVAAERRRQILR